MKKLSVICIIVVLALAAMGFGFAKWSDTMTVGLSAATGTLSWGFVSGSFMQKDAGPDWTCDDGLNNVRPVPEGKNVGATEGVFSDSDGDGVLDTLTVTVRNAYPCYYNEASAKVQNYGTIPVKIQKAVVTWMGSQQPLDDGIVYAFHKNGAITVYDGTTDTEVIEFCWMNNTGTQQHPGQRHEESFDFHVLQPAEQGTTYTFAITLEAVQWNESPI
jgi:hypothetical protein